MDRIALQHTAKFHAQRISKLIEGDVEVIAASNAPFEIHVFESQWLTAVRGAGSATIARNGPLCNNDVYVMHLRKGAARLLHPEGSASVGSGQFVAFRGTCPIQVHHAQSYEFLALRIPRPFLERYLPEWQEREFVPTDLTPESKVMFGIADSLIDAGGQPCGDSLQSLGRSVAELLARALGQHAWPIGTADNPAEAHRRRVRQFCRAHLHQTDLSVDVIASGTGLSKGYLHRLFQSEPSSLMQWVQSLRLEAARQRLEDSGDRLSSLTDLALSCGFKSPAHFSSAFRSRYGTAPSQYRANCEPGKPLCGM
ncbi:MAG: helix-turn-helix domain-containing protein [Pigmentiphaga sp.]|uniref:helix-turn-helix domain-containing protein n=1 Tax=Pigmentiphaga sp. TaxID=1977564 RepID=UPI003B557CB5